MNGRKCLIRSNQKADDGNLDIEVRSLNILLPPISLGLKVAGSFKDLESACKIALDQIERKRYDSWIQEAQS